MARQGLSSGAGARKNPGATARLRDAPGPYCYGRVGYLNINPNVIGTNVSEEPLVWTLM